MVSTGYRMASRSWCVARATRALEILAPTKIGPEPKACPKRKGNPITREQQGKSPGRRIRNESFAAVYSSSIATSLLMAAILLVGIVAFKQLPVSALPEVDYPTMQVVTFYRAPALRSLLCL
jgi:hypothetical protein